MRGRRVVRLLVGVVVLLRGAACLAADYPAEVLADNPLAYWRLEETEGPRAADAGGNGRDGTYGSLADAGLTPRLGQPGATPSLGLAADLVTGAMGYLDAPGEVACPGHPLTVEMWLKPTGSGFEAAPGVYLQTLASTVPYGGQAGWDLGLRGDPEGGWAVRLSSAGRAEVGGDVRCVPHGVWSHLVVTVDAGGMVAFHVNGAVSHRAGPLPPPGADAAPLRVGAPATPRWNGNFAFFGWLDEVAVYDRVLAPERVAAHFRAAGYAVPGEQQAAQAREPVLAAAGRQPYTTEERGLVLLAIPERLAGKALAADILLGDRALVTGARVAGPGRARVLFPLGDLPQGESTLVCRLSADGAEVERVGVPVVKAPPNPNEARVDCLTGGLIVDGLPTVPFGFYCDPDPGDLADQEVVNGFNVMAPYWSAGAVRPEADLARVRRVMDRCAAVGMRVHYHVNDLGPQPPSEAKWAALRAEVEAFRDHPALLAWYLADEPDSGVPFAFLEEARRFIHGLDPYHPVTLVLMGADRVTEYGGGADILMGDPYPIPDGPVTATGEWVRRARELTGGLVPVWIVPQAFGGGEGTPREPTRGEVRAMTYLALINGATGVQYFVRRPPLGNPKSPVVWSECRIMAVEVAELTPALLSAEPAPPVRVEPDTVQGRAFLDRGLLTLVVVNTRNEPTPFTARLQGVAYSGPAALPFEHRQVEVNAGALGEPVDAYGTRVYQVPVGPLPAEDLAVDPGNLLLNPSWEEAASPGTPQGCYLTVGGDRGSSAAVDARLARHGRHCLRLTTATEGQGMGLSAFPAKLTAGREYTLSVWARGLTPGLRFRIALPGVGGQDFELTDDWRPYRITGRAEADRQRANVWLSLTSAGTAWFDLLQLVSGDQAQMR